MENKIQEIDWSSLTHAYGNAEDVPHLLLNLQSNDSNIRSQAYNELFGNIWHQGTIYSATAYAVPFLFDLLDSPLTQDRDMLITLLASIASGKGYYQVHQPIFEEWNPNIAKHEAELERETLVISVRKAISPRFLMLLEELANKDSEVRLTVAEATQYYPEYAEISLSKLKTALEIETNEEVIEMMEDSITHLSDYYV